MMMGTKSPVYCKHHYSELPISTTATDSSDSSTTTYAIPDYPSSEGIAYSMSPIYQQPLCNCHQINCPQQPITQSAAVDNRTNSSMSTEKTVDTATGLKIPSKRGKLIAWVWASASLILLLVSVLCMTQPYWLVSTQTQQAIGLLSQVKLNSETGTFTHESYALMELPSICWKVSVALYSIATSLLAIGTLLAFTTILLTERKRRERMTFISGYIQLFGVILLTTALLFYMVGLDSTTATSVCVNSSVFFKGDCELGWSCVLLIIGTALGFALPLLSHYIDYNQSYLDISGSDSSTVSNHFISAL